jgi:hypothetical protein
MAIYLCRWPNGEFSIVNAKTKDEAIELLDEWGNAEQAFLTRMNDCMIDFRLTDEGKIELANISEYTERWIRETCYPNLEDALATAELDEEGDEEYSEAGLKQVREAVELERTRLWDSQPPTNEAETEVGREIQKQLGAASVVVNRIVREAARKRLKSKEGEAERPN